MFKTKRNILLALALCAVLLSMTGIGNDQKGSGGNPGVLPPQSNPYGKSYGEWQQEWVRWSFSFPMESNPMADPDGRFAGLGQSGPVWLLANVMLPEAPPTTRTFEVPAGKAIFFPIICLCWVTIPWDYNPDWQPGEEHLADDFAWFFENESWIREFMTSVIGRAEDVWCEIDGVPVKTVERYRRQSEVFTVWFPEDNLFDMFYPSPPYPEGGLPEGVYGPAVDEGYYLMLSPLPVGEHTIRFHAHLVVEEWGWDCVQDLTCNLTVVPGGEAE